jgi:hypothetical protein
MREKEKKMMKHNKKTKQEQQKRPTRGCCASRPTGMRRPVQRCGLSCYCYYDFFFSPSFSIPRYLFIFSRSARRYFLSEVEGENKEKADKTATTRERVSIALDWKSNLIASHAKPLLNEPPDVTCPTTREGKKKKIHERPSKEIWIKKKAIASK